MTDLAARRFGDRAALPDVDSTLVFAPKFDGGLIPCIATDAATGEVVMFAHMNAAALAETIATGIAHYWSRSRNTLWRKGETSGNLQRVVEMRTDCDQDVVLLKVATDGHGAACHTGRRSCFYRSVAIGPDAVWPPALVLDESDPPRFDPALVYPGPKSPSSE